MSFKILMSIVITAATPVMPTKTSADENADICKALMEVEESFSKRMPMKSDSVTDVISMRVNCTNTTQTWVKRLKVSEVELASGWRERKQRQHSQLNCNREGLSNIAKWTVIDVWYDKDYNWLAEFVSKPEMCLDNKRTDAP